MGVQEKGVNRGVRVAGILVAVERPPPRVPLIQCFGRLLCLYGYASTSETCSIQRSIRVSVTPGRRVNNYSARP